MTEPRNPADAVLSAAADAARVGLLPESLIEFFGEPIHTYTRAQAIADGALVDVTERAREAGFRIPVAVTASVWADAVAWAEADEARKPEGTGQDEIGRLWDLLMLARYAAGKNREADRIAFSVHRVPAPGRGVRPRRTDLVLGISGGDNGEPVITIMKPDED